MTSRFSRLTVPRRKALALFGAALALTACGHTPEPRRAAYLPLADLESTYGRLITAGNHPTPNQNGTGDRLGLFLDANSTVWGLPLTIEAGGAVLGCAPPALRDSKVTGTYPAGATILGATNEPTGWRGGTGKLELLLRRPDGGVEWRAIDGAHLDAGPVCWAQESPGPRQRLEYYRLLPAAGRKN